jgi:hypothetical protein
VQCCQRAIGDLNILHFKHDSSFMDFLVPNVPSVSDVPNSTAPRSLRLG